MVSAVSFRLQTIVIILRLAGTDLSKPPER